MVKRYGAALLVVLGLIGVVGVLAVGTGFAKDEDAGAKCSEATLHGRYLFAYDGSITEGEDQGPFAVAGYNVFHGNGKVDAVVSSNFNGKVTSPPRQLSGTYTVKTDCTGTSTYPGEGVTLQFDLFIAPDGSMITFVQTEPSEVVAAGSQLRGTAKRVGD
jgi:hypothetical protein